MRRSDKHGFFDWNMYFEAMPYFVNYLYNNTKKSIFFLERMCDGPEYLRTLSFPSFEPI